MLDELDMGGGTWGGCKALDIQCCNFDVGYNKRCVMISDMAFLLHTTFPSIYHMSHAGLLIFHMTSLVMPL